MGTTFDALPRDTREEVTGRLHDVLDPRLPSDPSPSQVEALFQAMLLHGYGRLDDAQLVELLKLRVAALDAVDVASCAAYGRLDRDAFLESTAREAMDAALTADQYGRYLELLVEAVEAEAAAARASRTGEPAYVGSIPDATMGELFNRVFLSLSYSDAKLAAAVLNSLDDTDASVCSAWRAIYHAVLHLEPADLATYARGDIVPTTP